MTALQDIAAALLIGLCAFSLSHSWASLMEYLADRGHERSPDK